MNPNLPPGSVPGRLRPVATNQVPEIFRSRSTPTDAERRLQEPLLRLLEVDDFDGFWQATRAVFQEILPEDTLTVYLNYLDFAKSWKASAMFATAEAVQSADWHDQRRRVEVTAPFLTGHPGVRLYRLSDMFPNPQAFQDSPLFRSFMRPYGWQDSVGLVYRRGPTVNSVISLRRPAACGAYRPEELRLLRRLHPHFEAVIRRLIRVNEDRARLDWFEDFNAHLPYALLQLDWEFHPVYANHEAMKQCGAWNFGPGHPARTHPKSAFRIPPPILDACRQLQRRWLRPAGEPTTGAAGDGMSLRLAHPARPALRATVTLQPSGETLATRPVFVIWLSDHAEPATGPQPLSALPAADRLTAAERELATLICSGCRNEEAAARLGKSPKTVAGQLTSIYRKLGVAGRARLIAALR